MSAMAQKDGLVPSKKGQFACPFLSFNKKREPLALSSLYGLQFSGEAMKGHSDLSDSLIAGFRNTIYVFSNKTLVDTNSPCNLRHIKPRATLEHRCHFIIYIGLRSLIETRNTHVGINTFPSDSPSIIFYRIVISLFCRSFF